MYSPEEGALLLGSEKYVPVLWSQNEEMSKRSKVDQKKKKKSLNFRGQMSTRFKHWHACKVICINMENHRKKREINPIYTSMTEKDLRVKVTTYI